ncbi:MAG: hypothetical protein IPK26_31475 [Planctomycetes bacterium]|nr:hypothetical protein [Planctomycetota bacterium]
MVVLIRVLSLALLLITGAIWWMAIDLWPVLPERLPLLPSLGEAPGTVPRTPLWWFGPPAVATLASLWLGIGGPRWWARRAVAGAWLPLPEECRSLELPPTVRQRVVQPCIAATVFCAICLQILVGGWMARAEPASASRRSGAEFSLVMVGASISVFTSSRMWARQRARAAMAVARTA